MAKAGQPGRALGLGITASCVGGLISWLFLWLLAEPMADLSTRLGPFDLFSLVLVALALMSSVSGKSLIAGLLSGFLGILAAMPGLSPATGQLRMTFGLAELTDGLKLLPVLIGLFAVSQVIHELTRRNQDVESIDVDRKGMFMSLADLRRQAVNLIRSSLIGTWIGILPGIGANIGSVMAYSATRNLSKTPEEFGHGAESGIVASESANNATVGGALIPLISIGIPGSVIDAILLGALVIHGLQPGPLLFKDNPEVVHTIIATVFVSNVFMFGFMVLTVGWLARLASIPRTFLLPTILVFCVVGAFALGNRMFDVWVMLAFGLIGYILERIEIPLAPFVIGFVLAPIAEENLGAGLMLSGGSYWPLVTRPVSFVFVVVAVVTMLLPLVSRWRRARPVGGS
jgi:putative tricarboxylic transport membrane protein